MTPADQLEALRERANKLSVDYEAMLLPGVEAYALKLGEHIRNVETLYNDTIALAASLQARAEAAERLAPVLEELARATAKFPTWPTDPLHAVSVLGEEFGELTKEVLQLTYEPHKSNAEEVAKEALQTAAMALRFYMSLGCYEYKRGPQHEQGEPK